MRLVRRAAVWLVAVVAAASPLSAQQTRNERIAAAFTAYDNFQTAQALDLLKRAVNPSEGPQDTEWFRAVQLLAEILIGDNKQNEATAWLRWAFRLSPNAAIDDVNRTPELVTAARAAQSAVAGGSPGDSVARTTWQWAAPGAGEGRGMLRIASPGMAQPVRALVQSAGMTESGRSLTLAAGTYQVQAAADGYLTTQVRREVLPGVTTVLSFNMTPMGAPVAPTPAPVPPPPQITPPAPTPVAPPTLTEAVRAGVRRQVSPVSVQRYGTAPACATAAFVGGSGLLLTTYQAIRGAERVEVELAGGRRMRDEVRVAAYDVAGDVAVLLIPTIRADSLVLAQSVSAGQAAWGFGFPDCRTARDVQVSVTSAAGGTLQLGDEIQPDVHVGPLVNASGAVVGMVNGARSAVGSARLAQVIDQARRNLAGGELQTVGQVALRENHAFGTVAINSDVGGAQVRIQPLESWQWPGTGTTGPLPLTFAGPMGRYHLELVSGGQVQKEQDFTVRPAVADRLTVSVTTIAQVPEPAPARQPSKPVAQKKGGGGGGIVLAILGVGAAGAAVAILAGKKGGGGGTTPPPTQTGTITVTVPNPSVVGLVLGIGLGIH
jgi:hypothetical protein